ncbi:MAG TPA: hypothetical protein VGS07_27850 [Thermoanaerobaculia bacterium]|jgi:hypothetical protein|nr:hypothetical protein [Thermoanaerobaculia bacterium]
MRTSRYTRTGSRPAILRIPAILALLGLLAPAAFAAAGYMVYLKDGHTIPAKEKYKVENGKAIITLLNGTQSFLPLDQVDVAKTDEANRDGYGKAVLLPGSPKDVGPVAKAQKDRTLDDLIRARGAAPRELPASRRDKSVGSPGQMSKTKAGFNDLSTLPQRPYANAEVTTELQQSFHGQGFEDVEIFEGTQGDRPLLIITTNSEGSVFKALSAAANALLRVRERFSNKVGALELLMTMPSRERAGQFVLTPDQASELAAKKVDLTAFFVRNVQF